MSYPHYKEVVLLFATFVISICALVYELLEGTISSYLLGDSIYQFSLTIGLFLSAMGVGAWISRYIENDLPRYFIHIQLFIGILGGFSALLLFFAFSVLENYTIIFFLLTLILGALIGIEIPLIMRMLEDTPLKQNISNLFTADYIGALFASLLFPVILLPSLGVMQTGFFMGLLNIGVAFLAWYLFKKELVKKWYMLLKIIISLLFISVGFFYANTVFDSLESRLYKDEVIFSKTTPYQRLTITNNGVRVRFFINGALQFDSIDEYRYHEMLVHPALSLSPNPYNILVLGGGDGMAIREILKHKSVENITLVDLDHEVTDIFSQNKELIKLNQNSLKNKKVKIIHQDAWKFLEESKTLFDVIIIDLPDPNNISLSRLYSTTFYKLIRNQLSATGIMVTQATSPLFSTKAFWSIEKSISYDKKDNYLVYPYHVYIPSFGEWGFVMSVKSKMNFDDLQTKVKADYFSKETFKTALKFSKDIEKVEVEPNRLSNHLLLKYYDEGWEKWY